MAWCTQEKLALLQLMIAEWGAAEPAPASAHRSRTAPPLALHVAIGRGERAITEVLLQQARPSRTAYARMLRELVPNT